MPHLVNTFAPQTSIGQGLNNAVGALFSGKGPKDEALNAAHMDAYKASAAASRAHASKLDAEAEGERQRQSGASNFLETALSHLAGVGQARLPAVHGYLDSGNTPQETVFPPETFADSEGALPTQDASWFTPGLRRGVDKTSRLASLLLAAKPSDIHQLAQADSIVGSDVDQAGVLEGSVDPTRFAQSRGKPVAEVRDGYFYNQADPNVEPRELGIASALIGERDSRAGRDDAAASLDAEKENTEIARQKNYSASAKRQGTAGSTKLVPIQDENGDTLWMPASEAAGEKVGKAAAPAGKKPLTKVQNDALVGALKSHEDELGGEFDAGTKSGIMSAATQYATDPKSEFYQDPAGAVAQAVSEAGEIDKSWHPLRSNTLTGKKNAPAAAGVAPAGKAPERGGKSDQQLLDEATAAIKKGAPRDAVTKRLRDMGVKVD